MPQRRIRISGLSLLKQCYRRMESEGATTRELIPVALSIVKEERRRARMRRPKLKKPVSRPTGEGSILSRLAAQSSKPEPPTGS